MKNKEALIQEAKDRYLGQNGCPKSNCAQAVADTFAGEWGLDALDLAAFAACGGGRAPGGMCGALYAAEAVLGQTGGEAQSPALEAEFREEAGSLQCRDIRAARQLPCAGCVETAAAFLCDHVKA